MKKSIVFYSNWGELIANLPTEAAGELIKMICAYSFEDKVIDVDNPMISAMFSMIKTKLDEDADAYKEVLKKRSEAGKKGMSARWSKDDAITSDNTVITNVTSDNTVIKNITPITDTDTVTDTVTDNDTDTVNDNDNGTGKDKRESVHRKRFTPPSLEEVSAYCIERGNQVDAQTFIDFYESKGWKVGREPMKDWRACIRTWERRDRASPKTEDKISDIDDYLMRRAGVIT